VTQVPITQNIIDIVYAVATHEGITSGLKIKTKSRYNILDSSWIARVDYKIDNDNKSNKNDSNGMHHKMDEIDPDWQRFFKTGQLRILLNVILRKSIQKKSLGYLEKNPFPTMKMKLVKLVNMKMLQMKSKQGQAELQNHRTG
jgi:hypothetical protein